MASAPRDAAPPKTDKSTDKNDMSASSQSTGPVKEDPYYFNQQCGSSEPLRFWDVSDSSWRPQASTIRLHDQRFENIPSMGQTSPLEIGTPDIFDFSSVASNTSIASDDENTLSACLMKIFDSARTKSTENGELRLDELRGNGRLDDSCACDLSESLNNDNINPCHGLNSFELNRGANYCPGCGYKDPELHSSSTSIISSHMSQVPSASSPVCSLCGLGQSVSLRLQPSYDGDKPESSQIEKVNSSFLHEDDHHTPGRSFFLDCLSTAEFDKVDKLRAWRAAGAALRQVLTKASESDTSGCTASGLTNISQETVDEEDPMNVMLEEFNASTTASSQEKEETETTQVSVLDRVRERLNAFNQRASRSSQPDYPRHGTGSEFESSQSPGLRSVREKIREITASRLPGLSGNNGLWSRRRSHGHRHGRSCQLARGDSQGKQNSSDSEAEESVERRLKPGHRCKKASCPNNSSKNLASNLPPHSWDKTQSSPVDASSVCAMKVISVSKPNSTLSNKNTVSESKPAICPSLSGSSIDSLEQNKAHVHPTHSSEVNDSSELELDSIAEKLCRLGHEPASEGSDTVSSHNLKHKRLGLVENDSMLNLADVESISEEVEEHDEEEDEEDTLQHHQDMYCSVCQDGPLAHSCSSCDDLNTNEDLPELSFDTDQDVEEPQIHLNSTELNSLPDLVSESCSSCASDQDGEEADDEFECDCMVCQERRAQFNQEWMTEEEEEYLGRQEDDRIEYHAGALDGQGTDQPYAINLAELTPLDLLLMREGRRELLELMFQNVILQMLAVYPDLLGDQAPPPATPNTINSLPAVTIRDEQIAPDFVCPICLCQFSGGEETRCLPCQHIFHTLCIEAWLAKSGTCPVCRHILTPQEPINSPPL